MEIVERMRSERWLSDHTRDVVAMVHEAADRLEALEAENAALKAENERLREALGLLDAVELTLPTDRIRDDDHVIITYKTFRTLRAALERIDHGDR